MTRDAWLYGGWTLQAGLLVHFAAAAPGPVTHIVFGDSPGAATALTLSTCNLSTYLPVHVLLCRHP